MSQNTLDLEITGLPTRDGYDLKMTRFVGADSVSVNRNTRRVIVSTSKQTEKVVLLFELIPRNPSPQIEAAEVESLKVVITIANEGRGLTLHTSGSLADRAYPIHVRKMVVQALDETDLEITRLPTRDGYDLKMTRFVGADWVEFNRDTGCAVVTPSNQTTKVVLWFELMPSNPSPQVAATEVESLKVVITIANEGIDLILHTSGTLADGAYPIHVRSRMGFEATDGTGMTPGSMRHLTSHHEHGMTLVIADQSPYRCSGCKESGIGDRYVCNEEYCPCVLHPDCRYHKEEATHEFLNGSTFKFFEQHSTTESRSSYCIACGRDIKGFFYHCDVTNKNLHPCCLNLKKTIHVGDMKFLLCEKLTSPCFHCHPKKNKSMDKCWCYSLETGQHSQAHVWCMKYTITECVKSGSKTSLMGYIKLKIAKLWEWVKMLLNKITSFFKSSKFTTILACAQLLLDLTIKIMDYIANNFGKIPILEPIMKVVGLIILILKMVESALPSFNTAATA